MSKSFLNDKTLPRGLRNNNVGNLIRTNLAWQGKIPFPQSQDSHFEQFTNIYYGIRAMYKDLISDINKGKNTVTKLINEYAPPHENNTKNYIDSVCKTLGVKPNDKLTNINVNFLVALGRAIIKVENGQHHTKITDSDLKKGISMLGNVSTNILTVDLKTTIIDKINTNKNIILGIGVFFYSVITLLII